MYMDADGDGRIAFADGKAAKKVTLRMAAPEDLVRFVESPPSVEAEEFCKPYAAALGCMDITIRANPDFQDVRMDVQASDLSRVTVATNVGEGGRPSAYPGSSTRKEDHRLWELVPLIAVKNEGSGTITVEVTGADNPAVESELYQKVACCTIEPKPFTRESTIDLDRPLHIRFYSWIVRQHSCQGVSQSGSYPVKCNGLDQELRDDFGQAVACGGETVPLDPKFIASDPSRSAARSRSGTTMYFVPNLFDSFMSDAPGSGRWHAWVLGGCKSDWFFGSLLREYEPDLLSGVLNS